MAKKQTEPQAQDAPREDTSAPVESLAVAELISSAAEQLKEIAKDVRNMTLPQLIAFLRLLYSVYGLVDPERRLEGRVRATVDAALDEVRARALRRSDVLYAISALNRGLNLGFADAAARERAQEGHNAAAALRAGRAGLLAMVLPLGLGVGCIHAPAAHENFPVAITITSGTEEFPAPQLAVEWPESVARHEDITTIQVDGRVISYAPISDDQATTYREALGQPQPE